MKNLFKSLLLFSTLTMGMCNSGCTTKNQSQNAAAPADTMAPCKSLELPAEVLAQRPQFKISGAVPAVLKPVGVYYEIDYSFYLYLGGTVEKCQTYFSKLFPYVQVAAAYDSINIYVAGLKIDTVEDGMIGNLVNFGAHMSVVQPHADIAQLLTRKYSGGIAYVGALCAGWNYQVSVCGMVGTVGTYPSYFWDDMVSMHEGVGHNLGAHHTFGCIYNGNNTPIDSSNVCWHLNPEGGCANGQITDTSQLQTFMSYWHGCPGGIIPRRGFGSQVRTMIRNFIYQHQSCLVDTGNPPPPPLDSCVTPANPSVWNISTSSAKLQWTPTTVLTNINGYSVQWKLSSSTAWTTVPTTILSYSNLTGLTASTSYDWRVQTLCKNGYSPFTPTITFTTLAPSTCTTPGSIHTDNITTTTATGVWGSAGAQRFNLWLRVGTTGTWGQNAVLGNFYTWTNLVPATMYQWQVQSICPNGSTSTWSPVQQFTTGATTAPCAFTLTVTDCATNNQHTFTAKLSGASAPTFIWKRGGMVVSTAYSFGSIFNTGDVVMLSVTSSGCATAKIYTKTIQ